MQTKVQESSSSLVGKFQPHQEELQLLGELAGIHMDSKVFRILVEFLNMGVDANTIFAVLKSIRRPSTRQSRSSLSHVSSHS
ncbi:hypothetical protein Zmor_004777 [Zophobas morio]|uniref:Uncharacterized protein n=1 Tax=Zophobas morio TaxID=2755281 RepID=A0AA38IR30_9CUCU|nr:hypothetical protein Zmor_004777 [Zophobas morio]